MKIIHTADLHLASKLDSKMTTEKANERRMELRATFLRLVEYATQNQVKIILLCGDIFDSDQPLKKDKEFFYNIIKATPQIDFFYLLGNHDSLTSHTETLPNLKTFDGNWQYFAYGDLVICGVQLDSNNFMSVYSTLKLEKNNKNVVCMHGQVSDQVGICNVALSNLVGKNIDYLALGHIHSYRKNQIDSRGCYCYSGCLEGRGFDETGEKGFVLIDTDNNMLTQFIPFAKRRIDQLTVNIGDAKSLYQAYEIIKNTVEFSNQKIVRIILEGELCFDNENLAFDLEKMLQPHFYFVSVKDKTLQTFNVEDYKGDISLKGEFIKSVLNDQKLSDVQKQEIINMGLKAINGVEVE